MRARDHFRHSRAAGLSTRALVALREKRRLGASANNDAQAAAAKAVARLATAT
jgi:hypothetical protein